MDSRGTQKIFRIGLIKVLLFATVFSLVVAMVPILFALSLDFILSLPFIILASGFYCLLKYIDKPHNEKTTT